MWIQQLAKNLPVCASGLPTDGVGVPNTTRVKITKLQPKQAELSGLASSTVSELDGHCDIVRVVSCKSD